MTRLRPAFTWAAFGLCLAVVVAAMIGMSSTMLRQERERAENDALALQAENERLALWRMESALIPPAQPPGGVLATDFGRTAADGDVAAAVSPALESTLPKQRYT